MPKPPMPTLESERVRLRPLTEADLPLTLAWRNEDDIRRWFFHSALITPEQHRAWFESYCEREDDFVFIIEEKIMFRAPVGQVAIYHVDRRLGRAEFGRLMIGDLRARGMGLAKTATQLVIDFASRDLGLHEVYLEVYEANAPALAIYRACGFVETGRRKGVIMMTRQVGESDSLSQRF